MAPVSSDDLPPRERIVRAHYVKDGAARETSLDEARDLARQSGLLWVHYDLERNAQLRAHDLPVSVPEIACAALTVFESRPRSEQVGDGVIINLRGLGDVEEYASDPLVSLRMWVCGTTLISASFRPLQALADVMRMFDEGRFSDVGDVIAALADEITEELDPRVAYLGDRLDDIESILETASRPVTVRRRVSVIRSHAISYRRFIAPQRAALERLETMQLDWLDDNDRIKIRQSADRCARMAEELEAVRERAAVAHEELTDLRAEKVDGRGLILSIIALIFLPITFITGLLGMNVGGVPFANHPQGFWIVTALCAVMGALIAGWFCWRHWLSR